MTDTTTYDDLVIDYHYARIEALEARVREARRLLGMAENTARKLSRLAQDGLLPARSEINSLVMLAPEMESWLETCMDPVQSAFDDN